MNVPKNDVSMKKISRSIVSLQGENEAIFTQERTQAAHR